MTRVCLLLMAGGLFFLTPPTCGAETVPGLLLPLREVRVGTPVEGLVREVLVEEGDTVSEGQVLLRLADEIETLEVERAEKILEKAKFDHEAAQKLLRDSIGTREEALRKSIEHDLARIQRDAALVRLRQRTLRAPMPGVVVGRDKEPGEAVQLNETVVHLVQTAQLEAQFYLEPAQLGRLKAGARLPLRVPAQPELAGLAGEVVFLDPRMDAESGLYRVKLRVDNAARRLKAGMRVELALPQP